MIYVFLVVGIDGPSMVLFASLFVGSGSLCVVMDVTVLFHIIFCTTACWFTLQNLLVETSLVRVASLSAA